MFKRAKRKEEAPWGQESTYFSGMGKDFLHVSSSWALLMSLAYPEVEHPLNWFKLKSDLDPIEIRNLMHLYKEKSLTVDELFQRVFNTGLTYREFIEEIYEKRLNQRFKVSSKMSEHLISARWSRDWEESLHRDEVNIFVRDCLGNTGATKSTWAGFPPDSWDFEDWWSKYYLKASLIGFNSIASIFNRTDGEFGWQSSWQNRKIIHGVACSLKFTATEPLDYLCPEMIENVEKYCSILGKHLRAEMKKDIVDTRGFDQTLFMAAKDGARIAAIGIDPSGIEYFSNGVRLQVNELPWLTESQKKYFSIPSWQEQMVDISSLAVDISSLAIEKLNGDEDRYSNE